MQTSDLETESHSSQNMPSPHPWIELGSVKQIKDGVYFVGSDEVWLTTVNGQRTAVSNICPHKMGPISQGEKKGHVVRCPWHGYWFDIDTGKCTPSLHLRRYEIKEADEVLYIRLIAS